ncbi:meprin A subunit beta isoform X2 [Nilaparvata lugens]|uniref:meprin A subunit beta isoform X2 n=1 Tax=Nilaparvata lugens TaxID=108931 RepID=UPI00193D4BDB|nr:meprin A subunit beta isoform X2 [Nilaparvata lugens]
MEIVSHVMILLTLIVLLDSYPTSPFKNGKFLPIGPGTDEGLYNVNFVEGDIYTRETEDGLKNAVSDKNLLWTDGVIIYKIDDDIGCPESPQCEILMKAMDHYHLKSCIRFKEWSGEPNYVQIFFNTNNSGACWSSVGRLGEGEQLLSLGQRCWYFGIVVHELGHAIGFWHEMNRPDRDDWIVIYWKNIIKGFDSAFVKHDSNSVTMMDEQFDYHSIMMYDEYAFSKDGRTPTLQARTGEEIGPIWRKKGLSPSDVRRLHKLYQCKGNAQHPEFPYDIACPFNNNSCGFKNGGSAVWNWRTVNETDGYMYSSWEIAGSTPGYLTSINFHPLSTLDKIRGPLGCARFWYLLHGDGLSFIKLSQIFLEHVTQTSFDVEDLKDIWFNDTVDSEWVHIDVPLYVTRPFKLVIQSQFDEEASYGTIALDDFELLYMECSQIAVVGTDLMKPNKPNQTDTDTDFDPDLDVDLEEIVKPSHHSSEDVTKPTSKPTEHSSEDGTKPTSIKPAEHSSEQVTIKPSDKPIEHSSEDVGKPVLSKPPISSEEAVTKPTHSHTETPFNNISGTEGETNYVSNETSSSTYSSSQIPDIETTEGPTIDNKIDNNSPSTDEATVVASLTSAENDTSASGIPIKDSDTKIVEIKKPLTQSSSTETEHSS